MELSELYTDYKKSKYFSNPARYKRPKLPFLNYLVKFLIKRKSPIKTFTIAKQTFF